MAFRLISHHKMRFSPQYIGGSSSVLTKIARRLLTIDVASPQEFNEKVLQSDVPVVVDFHAGWCSPCKQLNPILQKVMATYDGKVNLVKVDIDELQDLAMDYGVMSIPYLLGMNQGEIIGTMVGLKGEEDVRSFVESIVKS